MITIYQRLELLNQKPTPITSEHYVAARYFLSDGYVPFVHEGDSTVKHKVPIKGTLCHLIDERDLFYQDYDLLIVATKRDGTPFTAKEEVFEAITSVC